MVSVHFVVTDSALLYRTLGSVVTRIPYTAVETITATERTLTVELREQAGAVLDWSLREPTDWVTALQTRARRS